MIVKKQQYLWSILPIILSVILSWEIKDEIWAAPPKESYEYTLDTEKEIKATYHNLLTESNGSPLAHYALTENHRVTLYVVGPVSLNEKGGILMTLPFTKEISLETVDITNGKEETSSKNITTQEWKPLGSHPISLNGTTPYWKIVNDNNVFGVGTKNLTPPSILSTIPQKNLNPLWYYKIQLETENTITIHLYIDLTTCPSYGFSLHLSEFNLSKDKQSKLYLLTNYDFSIPLQIKEDTLMFNKELPDILIDGFFTLEQTIDLIP